LRWPHFRRRRELLGVSLSLTAGCIVQVKEKEGLRQVLNRQLFQAREVHQTKKGAATLNRSALWIG
jgi:hypothetical protein